MLILGQRWTSQSNLGELIPSFREKVKELLKPERSLVKACSVIFDGFIRLREALTIIVRFLEKEVECPIASG